MIEICSNMKEKWLVKSFLQYKSENSFIKKPYLQNKGGAIFQCRILQVLKHLTCLIQRNTCIVQAKDKK